MVVVRSGAEFAGVFGSILGVVVDLKVLLQVRDVRERLGAVLATVWLLTGVESFVAFQVRELSEGVAADLANERLLTTVDSFVFLQGAELGELLAAGFQVANELLALGSLWFSTSFTLDVFELEVQVGGLLVERKVVEKALDFVG